MATYAQFIAFDFTTTYPGATITHYAAGTTTLQNVWTDRAKTTPAAQPVVSDSNGVVSFYGDGIYDFVVKTTAGVTLYTWSNVNLVDLPLTGKGANLASAATITFGTDGDYFHITGATGPITNFSGTQGQVVTTFDSTPTLTHSANIILKGATNYVCVANDVFGWVNEGSGVWREIFRSGTNVATVASGGTGVATLTNHGVLLGQGTSPIVATAAGTAAQGLISGGASADPFYVEIDHAEMIRNATFTATVAANALTLALKTKAGTDPSATDPVYISFRPAGLTSGLYVTRTITAALSVVVSSGSTLGTSNGTAARLYLLAIDNAGTVELALWNPLSGSNLLGINESGVISTTAEGGAGAADSAQVAYSTTARANVPVRVLGYIEITEATAGTWATAPTVLQLMGPGVRRTGDTVQQKTSITGGSSSGTSLIPFDNTIPQITEGDQYMSITYTPTSSINRIFIQAQGNFAHSINVAMIMALFQDAIANALQAVADVPFTSGHEGPLMLIHEMAAGSTSSTTMAIRAGARVASTTHFNNTDNGTATLGGVLNSYMRITEVFV